MMVSYSNGSLSDEASNKRPLENGYVPKYKPRKVSAIREFPPGCGPKDVPENLKPEDNGVCQTETVGAVDVLNLEMANAVVANGAETSMITYPMEAEVVGNSEISKSDKLNEIKDSGKQKFGGSNGVKNSEIKERQPQEAGINSVDADGTKSLEAIVEEVMANVNVSKKLVMEIGPLGIQLPDEVGSHGHGAVNNPIEMERDQLLDSYVGEVTTTVTNGFSKEGEELLLETNLIGVDSLKGMKSVTGSGGASVETELVLCNPRASSSLSGGIEPEISIRPKDKYRPRRVSAIRNFPPLCGTQFFLEVKEKQMVMSGYGCLDRTEEVKSAPSAAMPKNVSERETTKEVLMSSQKGCLVGLQNVPIENDATETLNDDAGRGLPAESAEAGPMDFDNCNTDLQHIGSSIMDTGGPVGKEMAVCSPDINDKDGPHHDSNKEVVHGLMAAPNCPWRKSKVALKNSDGGTSGQKLKQQNSSQTQKPNIVALDSNPKANCSGGPSVEETAFPDSNGADGTPDSLTYVDEEDCGTYDDSVLEITPLSKCMDVHNNCDDDYVGPIQNDIIVYTPGETDETGPFQNVTEDDEDREIVHGLMAAPNCPWRKGETVLSSVDRATSGENKRKPDISWRKKAKARKSTPKMQSSGAPLKKKSKGHVSSDVDDSTPIMQSSLAPSKKKNKVHISSDVDDGAVMLANKKPRDIVVNLPPFGTKSSGPGDARMRVRETLRHFYTIYRKSLQQEEANSKPEEEGKSKQSNRIDLTTAKFLKDKGQVVNTEKIIGAVPGVEVGDEFQYRVELAVVGIHFPYQSGIDSAKVNDVPLCTSIVASGGYSDNLDDADVLIYSGQGGNVAGNLKAKQAEDQKLERGNLALKNCIEAKSPVRVVRGWKESKIVDPMDMKPKLVTTYIYDGLYTVTDYWTETGPRGKQVFQFKLERNPGQPELAWKELKKSKKFKTRPGTCVSDISEGKEPLTISAVNTIDDQKPPPFTYISKMMYPDWLCLKPPRGCDCTGRCSGSKRCLCAVKNGGEIPYNRNGALVETKTLVYECGPHCKCPPSCYNRTSQRGIKYKLEIFKTESRGWGVRPLTSIPSGSFICEYAGELLEDKEAEQRIGNDEYLFDIGHDVSDSNEPEGQENGAEITEEGGFTIDACQYGNVGRFINHSCLPNLHAQNVIFDHDNKRMPHIMLFAMENIPPLQELTYHYNYRKGEVRDSEGNVKKKECYCGAEKCDGKLY